MTHAPAVPPRGEAVRLRATATRPARTVAVLAALSVLLGVAAVASLAIGAVEIPPREVIAILADRVLGVDGGTFGAQNGEVLMAIRLPRIALACLVGAGLAVAGAALQGVFRNPLADPGIVGAASGASLGATLAIVAGLSGVGALTVPAAAFVGAFIATLVVYALSRRGNRTEVVTLLLTGLAVTAIVESAVGFITSTASDAELRDLTFWRLGSVGGATWETVRIAAPIILLVAIVTPLMATSLNLMALGEREASHLGVSTERVRLAVIVLSALGVGASVAAAGMIVFVGLLVPHLVRLIAGPDHRVVLPACALGGATLLLAADLVSRTVIAPVELPLGVVTGILGGPFFLWLLHSTRRSQGGWA